MNNKTHKLIYKKAFNICMKYQEKIDELYKDRFIVDMMMVAAPITTLESIRGDIIHPDIQKSVDAFLSQIYSIIDTIKQQEVGVYGNQEKTE